MVQKFSDRLGWNAPWKMGNNFEDFDFCGKFDLNELQRNFRFPLQIISARLLSTSDIYPVPIAGKHMY